jgi:EIN3-binding F-box protein
MPVHSVEPVAQQCPKLQVIKLVHCESIMELFLSWISMACLVLKELSVIEFSIAA